MGDDGKHFSMSQKGNASMTDTLPLWLQDLKAMGKSQGYLTYAQINGSLPLHIVEPEEIEKIVGELKHSGIRIEPA